MGRYVDKRDVLGILSKANIFNTKSWDEVAKKIAAMPLCENVVELPCKVGDEVYFLTELMNEHYVVQRGLAESFIIDDKDRIYIRTSRPWYEGLEAVLLHSADIGGTVFFDYDEAVAQKRVLDKEDAEPWYCEACGAILGQHRNYCGKCGAKVEKENK